MDYLNKEDIKKLRKVLFLHNSALKTITTKIEILNENYKHLERNPIEHIKSRIKSYEGIFEKLGRKNLPKTYESAIENIEDIAGVRIICSSVQDIYELASILKKQQDIEFLKEVDYATNPKPSGYRSYHMIVKVPIYTPEKIEHIKVEIQIRTAAMDFWACLEHKARYKYDGEIPEHLKKDLKMCADKIYEIDRKMFYIQDSIKLLNMRIS